MLGHVHSDGLHPTTYSRLDSADTVKTLLGGGGPKIMRLGETRLKNVQNCSSWNLQCCARLQANNACREVHSQISLQKISRNRPFKFKCAKTLARASYEKNCYSSRDTAPSARDTTLARASPLGKGAATVTYRKIPRRRGIPQYYTTVNTAAPRYSSIWSPVYQYLT